MMHFYKCTIYFGGFFFLVIQSVFVRLGKNTSRSSHYHEKYFFLRTECWQISGLFNQLVFHQVLPLCSSFKTKTMKLFNFKRKLKRKFYPILELVRSTIIFFSKFLSSVPDLTSKRCMYAGACACIH